MERPSKMAKLEESEVFLFSSFDAAKDAIGTQPGFAKKFQRDEDEYRAARDAHEDFRMFLRALTTRDVSDSAVWDIALACCMATSRKEMFWRYRFKELFRMAKTAYFRNERALQWREAVLSDDSDSDDDAAGGGAAAAAAE